MKQNNLKEWFRAWDEDRFDFTEKAAGEMHPDLIQETPEEVTEENLLGLEHKEKAAFQKLYPFLAVILITVMIAFFLRAVFDLPEFGKAGNPTDNEVVDRYLRNGMEETGAVNAVSGIILDYRAFDTLGESHVLFAGLTAVMILLLYPDVPPFKATKDFGADLIRRDVIVGTTAKVLVPVTVLFGSYVILNGHLGPGGGFSGGAIIGAGFILYSVAFGYNGIERYLNFRSFRIVCACALCFYSVFKCYSFFCGANGFHTIFSAGTPGRILSAGLILPLNAAVGIVVACTMYGLYSMFQRGKI